MKNWLILYFKTQKLCTRIATEYSERKQQLIPNFLNSNDYTFTWKRFLSNWTPLDTSHFPLFWFLDITLWPTHRPSFPHRNRLLNQFKPSHKQNDQNTLPSRCTSNASWCAPICQDTSTKSVDTLWMSLSSTSIDSSGFLRHLESI